MTDTFIFYLFIFYYLDVYSFVIYKESVNKLSIYLSIIEKNSDKFPYAVDFVPMLNQYIWYL